MTTSQFEIRNVVVWDILASPEIIWEEPVGTINGINTNFALANIPIKASVYLNGVRYKETVDYTLASNIITMSVAPIAWEILLVDYTY